MHCFRHPGQHAVAVCKHCGKAACGDCCEDTLQGIACSADCAKELQEDDLLNSSLKQSYGIGAKPPLPASIPTYFFFGIILLVTSFYLYFSQARIDYMTLAMSAVFFVMSGGSYKRYRDVCSSC